MTFVCITRVLIIGYITVNNQYILFIAFRYSNGCFEQYAEFPQKSAKDI